MFTDVSPPTLIAEGTQIHGSVTFVSSTHVAGLVEGDLDHQTLEPLAVGKTGWVRGSITARGPVLVEGKVDGSIQSETLVRLLPTAEVKGRLLAPTVKIAAGAMLEGEVSMNRVTSVATHPTRKAA